MNVAMTRAREVFYVLGGKCEGRLSGRDNAPAYVRYKGDLDGSQRTYRMRNQKIQGKGHGWLETIQKKEVTVTRRYSEDARSLREEEEW